MREGAFWAAGAGVAVIVTCVLPVLQGDPITRWDYLVFVAAMFLAPSAVGMCVSVATRRLPAWGTWALAGPCVFGAGVVLANILYGSSLWGPLFNLMYSTIPLVGYVVLLRLSWLLGTRLTAGLQASRTSPV
jgi:hypothetical protein